MLDCRDVRTSTKTKLKVATSRTLEVSALANVHDVVRNAECPHDRAADLPQSCCRMQKLPEVLPGSLQLHAQQAVLRRSWQVP